MNNRSLFPDRRLYADRTGSIRVEINHADYVPGWSAACVLVTIQPTRRPAITESASRIVDPGSGLIVANLRPEVARALDQFDSTALLWLKRAIEAARADVIGLALLS